MITTRSPMRVFRAHGAVHIWPDAADHHTFRAT
jgi:hypothetical protein